MFFKVPAIREDVFTWINDLRKGNLGGANTKIMKQLILKNMSTFIEMDGTQSIRLTEKWLDEDYLGVVESINESEHVFKYLTVLLQEKEKELETEYNQLMLQGGKLSSRLYNEFR